jgi:hypothetical protein
VISYHDAIVIDSSGDPLDKSRIPEKYKRNLDKKELRCAPVLPFLSLCFENKLKYLPPEYFRVMNGDIMIIALLGEYGKGSYQENIRPAAYRKHDGGSWTSEERMFQLRARTHTTEQLIKYCSRKGSTSAIQEHKRLYIDISVERYNISINRGAYLEAIECLKNILYSYTKFYVQNIYSLLRVGWISMGYLKKRLVGFSEEGSA